MTSFRRAKIKRNEQLTLLTAGEDMEQLECRMVQALQRAVPPFLTVLNSYLYHVIPRASLIAQLVNNPPAMQEAPVQFLGQEDPLQKG